ncbi:MAG: CDP-alcohol phosphatidyltransferase family protein [Planctomycetota bacterium]|nr:CDP-alcohol phosphatidyltransferase family protein [Planctomycetota bacterium]
MRKMAVLPSLFTLGNGACGFSAIVKVSAYLMSNDENCLVTAAWLILAAMLFDAFDGGLARLTRASSDFGAQLDSLSDAISFGVAPAVTVVVWNSKFLATGKTEMFWAQVAWFFSLLYVMGAILRLARFNVENKPDVEHHMRFKGLPSPGAGGLVASLVILHGFLSNPQKSDFSQYLRNALGESVVNSVTSGIRNGLPLLMIILAFLMVSSRIHYAHLLNRFLRGKRTFDYLAYLVFVGSLAALVCEVALAVGFVVYVAYGPVIYLVDLVKGRKAEAGEPSLGEQGKK